jgi:hypothetical protein
MKFFNLLNVDEARNISQAQSLINIMSAEDFINFPLCYHLRKLGTPKDQDLKDAEY